MGAEMVFKYAFTEYCLGKHTWQGRIEERINYLGGRMKIESTPGEGWTTSLMVPKDAAGDPVASAPLGGAYT